MDKQDVLTEFVTMTVERMKVSFNVDVDSASLMTRWTPLIDDNADWQSIYDACYNMASTLFAIPGEYQQNGDPTIAIPPRWLKSEIGKIWQDAYNRAYPHVFKGYAPAKAVAEHIGRPASYVRVWAHRNPSLTRIDKLASYGQSRKLIPLHQIQKTI